MRRHRRSLRRAFTLIELILVSVIFATVTASLVGFLGAAIDNISFVTQESRKGREGPAVIELMNRDISNAFVDPRLEKFFLLENGDGEPNLQFVTSLNSTLFVKGKQSDVVETGYWIEKNDLGEGTTKQLYTLFRREDYGLDEEPLEGGKAIPIASNVTNFRIAAYDFPVDQDLNPLDDFLLEEMKLGSGSILEESFSWETTGGLTAAAHASNQRRLPYALRIEITFDIREGGERMSQEAERDGLVTYVTTIRLPQYGLEIADQSEGTDDKDGRFSQIKLNAAPKAADETPKGENNGTNPPADGGTNPPANGGTNPPANGG